MKLLFVMNTPGFLRYFDETLRQAVARGHRIDLAFVRPDLRADALGALPDHPALSVCGVAPQRGDAFAPLAAGLRAAVDYLRYLHPRYAEAEYLRSRRRTRAFQRARALRFLGDRATLPAFVVDAVVDAGLFIERAIPSAANVEAYIARSSPDAVVVSPLVSGASPQTDYVKSARALGVPTALAVASWDNLTNKGLMRELPDRVIVWNEAQRREAVELHGVSQDAVIVTGAQPFDRWFGRRPARDRAAFCMRVGLDPARPYVLFVGSTSNIARQDLEEAWVARWAGALRAARDRQVREAGIMVRPHPDRPGDWGAVDLHAIDNAALWPPRRPNSVTADARADYFDSLYHSAAVVGINTSAMIEAAIIGRPVLTIRAPEFEQAQAGTLHFEHLLPEHGGFVESADDLEDHARQLAGILVSPKRSASRSAAFVARFIRPYGGASPCTPRLVAALEATAATTPRRASGGAAGLVRTLMRAFLAVSTRRAKRRLASAIKARALRRAAPLRRAAAAIRPHAGWLASAADQTAGRIEERGRQAGARRKRQIRSSLDAVKAERVADKAKGARLLRGEVLEVD